MDDDTRAVVTDVLLVLVTFLVSFVLTMFTLSFRQRPRVDLAAGGHAWVVMDVEHVANVCLGVRQNIGEISWHGRAWLVVGAGGYLAVYTQHGRVLDDLADLTGGAGTILLAGFCEQMVANAVCSRLLSVHWHAAAQTNH